MKRRSGVYFIGNDAQAWDETDAMRISAGLPRDFRRDALSRPSRLADAAASDQERQREQASLSHQAAAPTQTQHEEPHQ